MTPCFAYETLWSARREPVRVVDREATHRCCALFTRDREKTLHIHTRARAGYMYVAYYTRYVHRKQLRPRRDECSPVWYIHDEINVPGFSVPRTGACTFRGRNILWHTVPPTSVHSADRMRYDKFSETVRCVVSREIVAFKVFRVLSWKRERFRYYFNCRSIVKNTESLRLKKLNKMG